MYSAPFHLTAIPWGDPIYKNLKIRPELKSLQPSYMVLGSYAIDGIRQSKMHITWLWLFARRVYQLSSARIDD